MYHGTLIAAVIAIALAGLFFSTLTYALRGFSRSRLHAWMKRRNAEPVYERVVEHAEDLAFTTAMFRLLCNILILICILAMFDDMGLQRWLQYLYAFLITGAISTVVSVVVPLAIARHGGEVAIGVFARVLLAMRLLMRPAIAAMQAVDHLVGRAAGPQTEEQEQQAIEDQILTAVEEGEKEGVVDEQEREMIESVIEFRDATAREVMTARTDIIALDATSTLAQVREMIEQTGHSRVPVYEGTLDHIAGVLYARDLLKYVGESAIQFDMKQAIRPALFAPETKPLRDLLRDFRVLKVHMAIILDEYGGTAGLVTIEDILEQLVGEISDEHEPHEPAMLKKIDERTYEVDARMAIAELNQLLPVSLPEDPEIRTLGGAVSNAVGRVPEKGLALTLGTVRIHVIDAEPQRVNRVRMELTPAEPTDQP